MEMKDLLLQEESDNGNKTDTKIQLLQKCIIWKYDSVMIKVIFVVF